MNDEDLLTASIAGELHVAMEHLQAVTNHDYTQLRRLFAAVKAADNDGGTLLLASGLILRTISENAPPEQQALLNPVIEVLLGTNKHHFIALAVRCHSDGRWSHGVDIRQKVVE